MLEDIMGAGDATVGAAEDEDVLLAGFHDLF